MNAFGNINDNRVCDEIQDPWPANVFNGDSLPADQQWQIRKGQGWRHIMSQAAPDAGYEVTGWTVTATPDSLEYCNVAIATQRNPIEEQAAYQAARLAAFQQLIPIAQIYRATLRKYFGDSAETNQTITQTFVVGYFLQVQQGAIVVTDKAQAGLDSQALNAGYQALSQWTGDGTTWTCPWESVP